MNKFIQNRQANVTTTMWLYALGHWGLSYFSTYDQLLIIDILYYTDVPIRRYDT